MKNGRRSIWDWLWIVTIFGFILFVSHKIGSLFKTSQSKIVGEAVLSVESLVDDLIKAGRIDKKYRSEAIETGLIIVKSAGYFDKSDVRKRILKRWDIDSLYPGWSGQGGEW